MDRPDADAHDEPFLVWLAACDEALARGQSVDALLPSAPPEWQSRFQNLQTLLQRLDHDRRGPGAPSGDERREPASAPALLFDSTSGTGRLGPFHIRRKLGEGGCGIVFLAWDPRLEREVALKIPRPEMLLTAELRQRFLREARAAGGLDHPNIVPVYEANEVGPIWYIASAYCGPTSLADWLKARTEPVPVRLAAELVATLAGAVHYTHGKGILHRDLKPGNVLLAPLPRAVKRPTPEDKFEDESDFGPGTPNSGLGFVPRITDFGLAQLKEQAGVESQTGLLLGTPAYMTPEQAQGQHDRVGPATDVFALGIILYEVLTGQRPFTGATQPELVRQISEEEPIWPRRLRRDVPRDLEAVCLKCLEKDPGRRYPKAGNLARDLRRFLADQPTQARPMGILEHIWKQARRHALASFLLAIALLAMLGLIASLLWHR